MAWSIGSLTLTEADAPDDGDIEFGAPMRWSKFNPLGFSGTILTYLSSSAAEHRVHLRLSETEMNALKAIAEAHTALSFVAPRPNLAGGKQVVIDEFSARWNRGVPGDSSHADYWYDVWVGMTEVAT